jgi:hypothetical protein
MAQFAAATPTIDRNVPAEQGVQKVEFLVAHQPTGH